MLPSLATTTVLPIVRKTIIGVIAALLIANFRRLLWPNSSKDSNVSEPLPPGSFGCPLFGHASFMGSREFGIGSFFTKMLQKFGDGKIWKYYMLGQPVIVMSGAERLKHILNQEFDTENGVMIGMEESSLLGYHSLLLEKDGSRHGSLRKLVGQALTPAAVKEAFPNIQASAEKQVQRILDAGVVKMEEVCTDFTLDIAWKQILGLKLSEDEIPAFRKAVDNWIGGMASIRVILNIAQESTPSHRARRYLVKIIKERIEDLKRNGPDASTLSGMVFASDEQDASQKLTEQEIIDNSLLLIFAGSETSASTLTVAMQCLGLHPQVWKKLVKEQEMMLEKHGDKITRDALEKECPYLDAVVKEAMRIKPIPSGVPRKTMTTKVMDGYQIPKGWLLHWSILLTHMLDPVTYKEDGSHMDIATGFVPERWLDDATRPSEFMPMGAGPRYCLGAYLGYAEMKVFLAVIARNVEFELAEPSKKVVWKRLSVLPKPASGVPIMARPKHALPTL